MRALKGRTAASRRRLATRAAFVGSPPELNTNSAWSHQATKNLP